MRGYGGVPSLEIWGTGDGGGRNLPNLEISCAPAAAHFLSCIVGNEVQEPGLSKISPSEDKFSDLCLKIRIFAKQGFQVRAEIDIPQNSSKFGWRPFIYIENTSLDYTNIVAVVHIVNFKIDFLDFPPNVYLFMSKTRSRPNKLLHRAVRWQISK